MQAKELFESDINILTVFCRHLCEDRRKKYKQCLHTVIEEN